MIPVEIDSRDGLTLVSYMTLPPGADRNNDTLPDRPVPLVIIPHDGPWARDSYGFNALHQWLANRGYAALSVNFRGSSGLGNAFLAQGDHAWGAAMQDDLLDAARWAVESGVTQAGTIALLGEGYGGYVAAAGLAFTPEQFACAAAIAPPLSLLSLTDSIPRSAAALRAQVLARVGDPRLPEDRDRLRERSIVTHSGSITRPFLIALGGRAAANRQDADAVMRDIRARGIPAVQIVFPDEGDAIAATPNRIAAYAAIEQFLGTCLHGRSEAGGPAFQNVNMQVFQGADLIPGLQVFARRAFAPIAAAPAPAVSAPADNRDLNAAYVPPTQAPVAAPPAPQPEAPSPPQ
jgi:dipeptidyl aminopeptidase/acylaminoacyl peptidase